MQTSRGAKVLATCFVVFFDSLALLLVYMITSNWDMVDPTFATWLLVAVVAIAFLVTWMFTWMATSRSDYVEKYEEDVLVKALIDITNHQTELFKLQLQLLRLDARNERVLQRLDNIESTDVRITKDESKAVATKRNALVAAAVVLAGLVGVVVYALFHKNAKR